MGTQAPAVGLGTAGCARATGPAADAPCSVVVPCHDGVVLTRACVASLLAQEPGGVPAEILIVDNGSTDATPSLGALDPRVRVLRQDRNLGFAAGVNAGVRAARQPFVLVLNNDTQAAANLVVALLAALADDPGLGAVAPFSNHVKGPARLPVGAHGASAHGRAELRALLAGRPRVQHVPTLAGLCLLLRGATFAEVGGFDERFGHGNFEDDDFCLRLRLRGYRLALAGAAFLHHEGHATFRRLGLSLADELARRRAQFVAKWSTDPAGRAHVAAWRGDLAGAAVAAREALACWPRWDDADWHLGRWHAAVGQPARAADHFAALARANPAHADALLALAANRLAAGDLGGAQSALRAAGAVPLSPGQQVELALQAGQLAYTGRAPAAARSAFTAAIELAPDDGRAHNGLGACLLAAGDVAAAAAHFQLAVERGLALAHTNLGICRARLGDAGGAHASFTQAAGLLPDDPLVRANLAASNRARASADGR